MSSDGPTALGVARARFREELPARARELRGHLLELERAPEDELVREQMRRRLHALYASAQVFQEQTLADALREAMERLDGARDESRALNADEFGSVQAIVEALDPGVPREAGAASASTRPDARISSIFSMDDPFTQPLLERGSEPPPDKDAPLSVTRSVAGLTAPPAVLAVLCVGGAATQRSLRAGLPRERFEVSATDEPDTALSVLANVAPDVLVLDWELTREDSLLLTSLSSHRDIPVRMTVLVLPADASEAEWRAARGSADLAIARPIDGARLLPAIESQLERQPLGVGLSALAGGTVDEIASTVAEEIRRGLSESLRSGRGERIELDDRTGLLAAAWSAVGRIRAHLAQEAKGRVRFQQAPGEPALLALTDDLPASPYVDAEATLRGRRVVVADDDPAVVWFFAGLLREAGAVVFEAADGREALELARTKRPDVVISDILMPGVDGFTLCRELQRDLLTAHVAVVLLSWKEDFLQRMRELESGAVGYLRKEAGSQQILETIADAVRPVAILEALLAAGDDVAGRLEQIGPQRLVETVAARRPDASITVRDAWNLFEIDVRGGSQISITRTASDGSFARGETALLQLMGANAGRYSVTHGEGPLRAPFEEPIDKVLGGASRRLAALLDALSDRRLLSVARIELDDDVLSPLLAATPTALAEVVAHFRAGETSARELLLKGRFNAHELEEQLRELARRGAVRRVFGGAGEDLVALSRREREADPGGLRHSGAGPSRPSVPPIEVGREEVEEVERPRIEPIEREAPWLDLQPDPELPEPPPVPPATPRATAAPRSAAPVARAREDLVPRPPGAPRPDAAAVADEPEDASHRSGLGFVLTLGVCFVVGFVGFRALQDASAAPEPFGGFHVAMDQGPRAPEQAPSAVAEVGAADDDDDDEGDDEVPALAPADRPAENAPFAATAPSAPSPGEEASAASDGPGLGRLLPFIDRSRRVKVEKGQGLLVLQYDDEGDPPRVRVGERDLGKPPIEVALPGGRHELVLRRDRRSSYRYVVIQPGHTRIVDLH